LAREIGRAAHAPRPRGASSRLKEAVPAVLVHASALAIGALVLVASGQPLFAEDTWWHLGMGEVYAARGPWLDRDPFLFTAEGPPAPAAWLSDLALHAIRRATGFQGLRVAHALAVAAILGLAWSALRRASGSPVFASLGTAIFAALSAYRLFQLRPDLATLAATLLLLRLLFEPQGAPSWRRVGATALLFALWANAHAGFVLGPALLLAGLAGLVLATAALPQERVHCVARARRFAAALGLGLVATLANPEGARPHQLYFAAGRASPPLELVADEWAPVRLLELPVPNRPPSPLAWGLAWGLVAALPCAALLAARARRRAPSALAVALDPALAGAAAASLVLLLSAVRLLWLAIVPLLLAGRLVRALREAQAPARRAPRLAAALTALLLVPAFVRLGDWPMISKALQLAAYAQPYPAAKHHAHAVWFLRDAELEGKLWNDYASGNFLGYWLGPRLRVFVNGSLNVPPEVMEARHAIVARRATASGETFEESLDRWGVDLFFGTGLPSVPPRGRPAVATTTHLEASAGWRLLFRNPESAVYLRADARSRANLERAAAYFAREGVPFDPERGFEVERVVREAPRWAVLHGLVPADFAALEAAALSGAPRQRAAARERLAALLASLGLYARAVALDRETLATRPGSLSAARRLVWSLLHLGRAEEAREAARELARLAPAEDELSRRLVEAARRRADLSEEEAAAELAFLPLLTRAQLPAVRAGLRGPEARTRRPRRPAGPALTRGRSASGLRCAGRGASRRRGGAGAACGSGGGAGSPRARRGRRGARSGRRRRPRRPRSRGAAPRRRAPP
jgi:hypothetical protein